MTEHGTAVGEGSAGGAEGGEWADLRRAADGDEGAVERVVRRHRTRLRRRRVVRFLPLLSPDATEDTAEAGQGVRVEPPDPAPGAPDRLDTARRWAAVRDAIEAVPPSQRAAVVLIELEGSVSPVSRATSAIASTNSSRAS